MKKNLPYNVMRHAGWEAAPRDPFTVGAYILGYGGTAGAIAAGGFAVFASYAVGYLATTAITSLALRALAPDMPTFGGAQNVGTLINAREATATQEYVYGQVRKGGTIVFMESTDIDRDDYPENGYMHIVIAMAGHEVQEIGDVYINDQIVTIDVNGFVTNEEWALKNSPDGGALPEEQQGVLPAIRIKRYNGSQTTADADLVAETSATFSFVGNGIAYMYVRLQFDRTTFANGIPSFTAVIKGKKVEDANGTPQVYPASANAALVIRDYLKSEYGLADSSIDETYFAVAANDCNDDIALSGGGTEKRYQINGVVNAGSTIGSALQDMVSACNGQLFLSGGLWRLKVGVYDASVKTLTLDDIRSAISLPTKQSRRDNFNRVVGKFINGGVYSEISNPNAGDWVEADYPAITSDAFLAEDNGVENQIDLPLMMVTSSAQAQRVAKQTLFRSREQITFSADFGLNAMDIEIGDVVSLNIDKYGWVAKEFECVNWKLMFSDQGQLTISMTLRETSEDAFDWNGEESAIINNNTNLPKYTGGLSISDLSVADGPTRIAGDGTYIAGAIVSWTGASSFGIKHYEVQWKREDDTSYTAATSSLTTFDVYPLQDGVSYNFRVRAVGSNDATGTWLETTYTAGGDTTAPAAPTGLSVAGELGGFDIEWTNPNDADFSYVKVYESSNSVFGNATFIGQSSGSNFLRRNLAPLVTKYYWVSAVDYSGNESGVTGPQFGTTTQITAADIGDAVIDYDNFAGDVTNLFDGIATNIGQLTSDTVALDAEVTTLQSQYTTLDGSVTANATAFSSLETRVTTAEGAITASASDITVLQSDLTTLDGTVSGQATAISGLDTRVTTAEGEITSQASALTSLSTTVGDNTTSISEAITSINGIEAKYGVTIDNNGNISGFQLLSGVGGSAFNVRADQFAVFDANNNGGVPPFTIFTSSRTIDGVVYPAGTYVKDAYIDNASIVSGSITNAKIADAAIDNAKIADAAIDNAKISNLSADKINAGTLNVDYLPGLTSINQTITTSNVSLVSSGSQYLITTTLSGIRAGTKVIGILTLNAYSTTFSGPGTPTTVTMEIIPQNITGLTAHTFTKNNHPTLGTSSSLMPMQIFIGTGTATGTSCQVQFRLGTAFAGETATMLAGASLTLLGYEV